MSVTPREKDALRRLAGEVAEIAALPVHKEKAAMWRRLNRLEPVRPLVWINEMCWEEMGEEAQPTVADPVLRAAERKMRHTLYKWRHLPVDMVVEDWIPSPLVISDTGFGLETLAERTKSDIAKNAIDYIPIIRDESDVAKIRPTEVTCDRAAGDRNAELLDSVLGDLLEVRQVGVTITWFAPWDTLIQWYGIEELYTDMIDRPELVRMSIARMTDVMLGRFEQYERMGLLSLNNANYRVGSGGLGFTDELPRPDFDGKRVRMIDMWGNSTPQIFSCVSPEMHWEFALKYEMRILERFGLNCYGCCEPLHHKVDILRRIPRLRRISMSPFVNIEQGAAAIGQDFIYSAKPNPAVLASNSWRPDLARRDLAELLEKTRGLHLEIILKDIHTTRGEPKRLWDWAKMAMEMVADNK
jgi:hypothetical protein